MNQGGTEPLPTCTDHLTGADFERHCKYRLNRLEADHIASIAPVETQSRVIGEGKIVQVKSKPDFEGCYGPRARAIYFDAKVCSQSKFDLNSYRIDANKPKSRQLKYMYKREEFGAVCFFLIHWNARQLKTKQFPAITYAFPVKRSHPFWDAFENGTEKSINRGHCADYGIEIPWTTEGSERTLRPDVMVAVEWVSGVVARVR